MLFASALPIASLACCTNDIARSCSMRDTEGTVFSELLPYHVLKATGRRHDERDSTVQRPSLVFLQWVMSSLESLEWQFRHVLIGGSTAKLVRNAESSSSLHFRSRWTWRTQQCKSKAFDIATCSCRRRWLMLLLLETKVSLCSRSLGIPPHT